MKKLALGSFFPLIIFTIFSIFLVLPSDAAQNSSAFKLLENSSSRLLYRKTGESIKAGSQKQKKSEFWDEYIYKFSLLCDLRSSVFAVSELAELQFLDRAGYILTADLISKKDLFSDREYFSYLWISKKTASNIESAKIVPVTGVNLSSVRNRYHVRNRLFLDVLHASGKESTFRFTSVTLPQKEFSGSYHETRFEIIFKEIEKKAQDTSNKPTDSSTDKVSKSQTKRESSLYKKEIHRITNEDITKALRELESAKPTDTAAALSAAQTT